MDTVIPVVAACIQSNDIYGRVLLTKRYSQHKETNNRWEFPGGVVETQEDLRQALIREISEELHLDVRVGCVLHAQINTYTYTPLRFLVVFYECFSERPIKESSLPEHIWVTLEEIEQHNPLPGAIEALRNL